MTNDDLDSKINKMGMEELASYLKIARNISHVFTIFGVGLFTIMLTFMSWFTVLPGMILVYVLANLSVGATQVARLASARIAKLQGR